MDIGIRELRQRLSEVLRRVAQGERIRVTHRGCPTAFIVPSKEHEIIERGFREGWIVRREETAPGPVPRASARRRVLEVLSEDRK